MKKALRFVLIGTLSSVMVAIAMADSSSSAASSGAPVALEKGAIPPTEVAERYPSILFGYLEPEAMPDGLLRVPEFPVQGSQPFREDKEFEKHYLSLQGSPRWVWAAKDADLDFPAASKVFSCAANILIEADKMPHLLMLLRRSLTDFGLSTSAVKKHYQRPRPFLSNAQAICIPDDLEGLKTSGSYPSGHAAIGWGWALVFAEMLPHRKKEIMARGRAYGDSRAICNVHWQSDVVAGQAMANAVYDNLRANAVFNAEFALAQAEINRAATVGSKQCQEESTALGLTF